MTERAALKQSTALSYSPLRLKRTPRPHCSWGSTWAGSELAACRNRDWTSVNKDLCGKTKKKGQTERESKREVRVHYYKYFVITGCWICVICFQGNTVLTLAAVTRTSPSPSPYLWHHPFGVHAHSAPRQSGILDCALASHGESHRPACAATRW